MGIRNYLRIIPFLLTATGIFFGHSDHPILYLFLTILIILSFYLHSRLPIWMFLFIAQVLIHLSGDKLVLFYLPILILISDPVITAAFIGSEIVVHLQKGGLFTFTYPIAIFVVIAYLLRNWLKEKHDNLKRELELIKKRSEFILTTEADTKQLLAGIKTSPHPAIYRPILHFLSYLRRSLAAQTVAFFYRSGDDLVLTLGASTIKGFREGVRVGVESGILGHVVKEKREVIIPEYGLPVKQLGYYADPKIEVKSLAVVPVLFGDELEGVLVIDSATRSYTTADREILRNASSTLAYLTGMVRLYEQQRRNAIHYSALYEMAKRLQQELDLDRIIEISAQVASAIFECDHVGIARVDPEINRGEVLFSDGLKMIKPHTSFSLDEGLVGWIAKYRRYLLNNQLKKGKLHRVFRKEGSHPYHSFIGVPIMAEEDVLGVIWVESRVKSAFREEDSELLNFLAFQLSLAWNRANLHKKVSELAISDSLTGLYNHRHFHEEMDRLLAKEKRLVLLMLDIDHFKKINDEYGHQVGDQVLVGVARLLQSGDGIPARYGGEEFALILPGYGERKGLETAIRLREKIKNQQMRIETKMIKVTVSIGLAFYPKDGKNKEELISKADAALYRAKREGRDRVAVA